MCELLAMSTRHAAQLIVSLEALARHSGPASGTRDGWGVAYFQGRDVALFREPIAASDSPLVRWLEQGGPSNTLAIAHIRRATLGTVGLSNTQPFVRKLGGRAHVFAHNGHLPGIAQSPALAFDRYRPIGDTDSEHACCALLERMHGLWHRASTPPTVQQRWAVVTQFAADLRPLGPANFSMPMASSCLPTAIDASTARAVASSRRACFVCREPAAWRSNPPTPRERRRRSRLRP